MYEVTTVVDTGGYKDNKRHGNGKEIDDAGNIFEGKFSNGELIDGIINYSNGDVYKGQVKDGYLRNGTGTFICSETGNMLKGQWLDDDFVK